KSTVARPLKELKGFKRVMIAPSQTITITLPITGERLAHWDTRKRAFVVEKGNVEVMVGASSTDIKLTKAISVSP
ncbi:MAG TPA: fibronectin type III-like domain-contianing protein, partial [Pyrinomonadaceae bacterium]|nr:fibronectin type III-like domain-contianing protein [Pyrinomonadaceae bacterium]